MSRVSDPSHRTVGGAAAGGVRTSPIIDYEPPAHGAAQGPSAHPATLRPRRSRPPRPAAVAGEAPVPQAAAAFADAALRRVLEVVDRRRPAAQLRGLLAPSLIDITQTLARSPQHGGAAVLRRIRLRSIGCSAAADQPVTVAEVFATYTRGSRVRALAARIELVDGRWQMVALQIG